MTMLCNLLAVVNAIIVPHCQYADEPRSRFCTASERVHKRTDSTAAENGKSSYFKRSRGNCKKSEHGGCFRLLRKREKQSFKIEILRSNKSYGES